MAILWPIGFVIQGLIFDDWNFEGVVRTTFFVSLAAAGAVVGSRRGRT